MRNCAVGNGNGARTFLRATFSVEHEPISVCADRDTADPIRGATPRGGVLGSLHWQQPRCRIAVE